MPSGPGGLLTAQTETTKSNTMTRSAFLCLCETYTVAPALALEVLAIRNALASRDDEAVRQAFTDSF